MFGNSLSSAAEQAKSYIKSLSSFKANQKNPGSYFTKMPQIFNLIPTLDNESEILKFDKCPFLFYSHSFYNQGSLSDDEEDEKQHQQQNRELEKLKPI